MRFEEMVLLIGAIIIGAPVGVWFHEGWHYSVGKISGGEPFVSKWRYFMPAEVDFENPQAMSDLQTRLASGPVALWPMSAMFVLGYIFGSGDTSPLYIIGFLTGASGVSWYDLFAAQFPSQWKKFTGGKEISRDDFR